MSSSESGLSRDEEALFQLLLDSIRDTEKRTGFNEQNGLFCSVSELVAAGVEERRRGIVEAARGVREAAAGLIRRGFVAPAKHVDQSEQSPEEIRLTRLGRVVGEQRWPIAAGPALASWLQLDLGPGFRTGVLERPSVRSDSTGLVQRCQRSLVVAPIVLLLWYRPTWWQDVLRMILSEWDKAGRAFLRRDRRGGALTTRTVRDRTSELPLWLPVIREEEKHRVRIRVVDEWPATTFLVGVESIAADVVRSVMRDTFGLGSCNLDPPRVRRAPRLDRKAQN